MVEGLVDQVSLAGVFSQAKGESLTKLSKCIDPRIIHLSCKTEIFVNFSLMLGFLWHFVISNPTLS
jgi:hypothetical protein